MLISGFTYLPVRLYLVVHEEILRVWSHTFVVVSNLIFLSESVVKVYEY